MKKILYIGNKLSKKGKTVTSIETLGNFLLDENFAVKSASNKSNKIIRLFDMVSLIVKNRKADYVLIDTYSTQNFYYALVISQLCRLLKINYIPILRGGNLLNRLKSNPFFSKWIFNNAFKNIVPSQYLYKSFLEYGYTNLKYIPNSIYLTNYPYGQKILDKPKLLWVRSFSEIYNPNMAIKVLKELLDRGYTAELCMVGPDSDGTLKDVKKLAKQLDVPVTFTGKLSKKEWIELAANYNIFINTTNFDNMPVSVIEAMALGLPVVSTNVGGMPYLIEDKKNGLLVNKNDVEGMTSQIIRLIKNPELAHQLSINARKKVEQFDWNVIRNKWKELLK